MQRLKIQPTSIMITSWTLLPPFRHFITELFSSLVYTGHPLTVLGDGRLDRYRNKVKISYGVASALGDDRTMLVKDVYPLFVESNHEAVDT